MKRSKVFMQMIVIACVSLVFMACPVATNYPLILESDALPFDGKLLGTWQADSDGSGASKIKIEKKEDNTYKVTVLQKSDMYTPETDILKGWLCKLEGNTYFVLQEYDGVSKSWKENYYFFEIKIADKKLITHEISLKNEGIDAVKSVETFQEEVKASSKMEGFLSDQSIWTKQ